MHLSTTAHARATSAGALRGVIFAPRIMSTDHLPILGEQLRPVRFRAAAAWTVVLAAAVFGTIVVAIEAPVWAIPALALVALLAWGFDACVPDDVRIPAARRLLRAAGILGGTGAGLLGGVAAVALPEGSLSVAGGVTIVVGIAGLVEAGLLAAARAGCSA